MLSVSVVIPTYNCEPYVATAIQSAIAQPAHEIIVIDDGSTDDTATVVKSLMRSPLFDTPLRYIYQPNQGVSAARNHGISAATGDLIAFLDADDFFLPHKLTQQVAAFEANPALGLVQCGWQRVDEAGAPIAAVRLWESVPALTLENWLTFKPVLPSALMVRREQLMRAGGFDPQLRAAEDVDLVSRLALQGCQSAWVQAVAVGYRQRSNSAMGNGLVQAQDLHRFLNKFFQQPDLPDAVQLLERSVRYHTLVWAAWYLQHTGHLREMAQYLQLAWQHTPYLPMQALAHWADSFAQFSQDWGGAIDAGVLIQSAEWQQLVQWLLTQKATSCITQPLVKEQLRLKV